MASQQDKIVLRFGNGSTVATTRDALCSVDHTWFKRAFCGRNDGLVVASTTTACGGGDDSHAAVVGSDKTTTTNEHYLIARGNRRRSEEVDHRPEMVKLVVQHVISQHNSNSSSNSSNSGNSNSDGGVDVCVEEATSTSPSAWVGVTSSALSLCGGLSGVEAWDLLCAALDFGVKALAQAAVLRVCEANMGPGAPVGPSHELDNAQERDEVGVLLTDALRLLLLGGAQERQAAMCCGLVKAAVAAKCICVVDALKVGRGFQFLAFFNFSLTSPHRPTLHSHPLSFSFSFSLNLSQSLYLSISLKIRSTGSNGRSNNFYSFKVGPSTCCVPIG